MGIHAIVMGCTHPLFFLTEVSDRSMKNYSAYYRWPDAGSRCTFFNAALAGAHASYLDYLRSNLPELVRPFSATFHSGYNDPSRRVTYSGWKMALAVQNRPEIISFSADRSLVEDTKPVRLSWETRGQARLELKGIADVTGTNFYDIRVSHDTQFRLVLTPPNGQPIEGTVQVTVSKEPPVIHEFSSDRVVLMDATPPTLRWRVTGASNVTINNGVGDVPAVSSREFVIRKDVDLTLTATSAFGAVSKATVQLKVSKHKPRIAYFRASKTVLDDCTPIQLNWLVPGSSARVTISGIGPVPNRGAVSVSPKKDSTFYLIATTVFGFSTVAHVNIVVSKKPPTIEYLQASPALVAKGDEAALAWKVAGAETIAIAPQIGMVGACGTHSVQPDADTVFVLRAKSCFGVESSRAIKVRVLPDVRVPAAEPIQIAAPLPLVAPPSAISLVLPKALPQPAVIELPSSNRAMAGGVARRDA